MIQLNEHFNYKKLLRYTFPSVVMLIFTSVYGVVDGFFVSNFVGKTSFAAVNLIMPFPMILGCIGFMFGTGGSAIIAKLLGEGNKNKANEIFSMIVAVSFICGVALSAAGVFTLRRVSELLGAEGKMLEECVSYGRIILIAIPAYILQYEFQCLFAAAGKPNLGLYVTIAAGVANIGLDALLVAAVPCGAEGAAIATAVSQCVGGFVPLAYFFRPNSSFLRFIKFRTDFRALLKTCANGSSELMSNISMSVVSMLYNAQLLKYAGENGVAAYGVLMYVNLVFQAVFIGFSVGGAPVISYSYGSENYGELKGLLKKGLIIISVFGISMFCFAELLAKPLSVLFVGYDKELLSLTLRAFFIYSFSFLCSGYSVYGSSFFTALNDGLISAVISFLRTLVFQIATVLILPEIWGIDGIWASVVIAEMLAVAVTFSLISAKKKKYRY